MIVLYEKNETIYTHNGLGILDVNIIHPIVKEELNGIFCLEFDYPIHAKLADKLKPEMLIKCPVPNQSDQLFRIAERSDAEGGLCHLVAYHVFYDLARNLIEDTFIVNQNGTQSISQLLSNTQFTHKFSGTSNITTVNNARLVRLNPVEVLLDEKLNNGFLARWGGEILRDNFHITINTSRGSNNGVQIRDKKNLTGYKSDVDYSTVVTRIMPEGFDGLFLPEKYVDSTRVSSYISPKIKVIKFDSVKVGTGEGDLTQTQAYAQLRLLAKQEFEKFQVDLPTATYEILFAPLERTEEYKNFSQLETISLGDAVTVIHEEDGLNISARMVSYMYNPLMKSYISIELGNMTPKFTDIGKEINRVELIANEAKDDANYAMTSANGKNTNFYGPETPNNARIGDVWYKENGDKLEMWVCETREGITQWFPLMTDLTQEEVKQAVEQAKKETAEAIEKANSSFDKAVDALNNASSANQIATEAFNKSVKSSVVNYAVGTSGTTAPTTGWGATIPTVTSTQFLWSRTVMTMQDSSFITSYSVSKQGEQGSKGDTGASGGKGDKGDKGDSGTDGVKISSVREEYYLSTSNTTQTGGTWSATVPTWSSGKYYWQRVFTTFVDNTTATSTPVLSEGLNKSLVTAFEAKTNTETLQTTVSQQATAISLNATNVTNLQGRVTTAEGTLTVQAGQIASKASQSTVETLTGRITTAESTLTQTAERFDLSLSKQNKAINDLTGAGILQPNWQGGSLSTSNGSEVTGSVHIRSGFLDVKSNSKFLLQTLEGQSIYSSYSTAYLFYYKEDKSFLSYTTYGNVTTPITAPNNARYLRIRLSTSNEPSTINCYVLPTEISNGFTDLTTLSNVVKLTATTDTLLFSVAETKSTIGIPFKVNSWQQGSLDANGQETSATNYVRSEFIPTKAGEKFIGQLRDGTSITVYYHFYGMNLSYTDFTPVTKQYVETFTVGTYTNDSVIPYLNALNIDSLSITGAVGTNPYSSTGDYLTIYKLALDGKVAPKMLTWDGRKDTSDNVVLLYNGSSWEKIGTVTSTSNKIHEWTLTDAQQATISGNSYVAFYSIKNGSYAGIYNTTTTPFILNPSNDSSLIHLSTTGTSGTVTTPSGTMKMRVRVNTTVKPETYEGNVYSATTREDFTKANSIYSAILMQKDLINLRVSKNDVVNQINLSTEGILISGNKIRISGQTTIDNAVITSAMMQDLSVTNAKIANATILDAKIASLDAAKITTGYLAAARIQAGSITSDKLTVANGFITNAMIANAAITSAKIASATITAAQIASATITNAEIASLNADKITAGTLTGRTIQTASSGNRVVITGGQDSLYFYGSYTNGTIDQYIRGYNLSGINISSIGTNKSFYVADHFVNDNCAHFNRIAPRGSNNWGIWVRDGEVGGHGGTYLESNNGKYGIHITEASLNIINNGKYTRMSDILAKCGFS